MEIVQQQNVIHFPYRKILLFGVQHSLCQPSASILLKVCAALFFGLDLPTKHIRQRLAGQNYVIPKKRVVGCKTTKRFFYGICA